MSALLKHIQTQQSIAMNLCSIIQALSILDDGEVAPDAVTGLIRVARDLAEKLNSNLDVVNLPKEADREAA